MSDPQRDLAAARWAAIQVVRAVGVATVLVGLLHNGGRIALLDGIPRWFGLVLVGIGFFEVFFLTRLLAQRWRSPDP